MKCCKPRWRISNRNKLKKNRLRAWSLPPATSRFPIAAENRARGVLVFRAFIRRGRNSAQGDFQG
jgi:hypothetical protein